MPGPFDFRDSSRRKGTDLRNLLEDLALPACAEGEEPADLEPGSIWWNTDTDTPRIRTLAGDVDLGVSGGGTITEIVTNASSGLSGGASTGVATLAVVRGSGADQTRHGNDAAYTDARTPTAHASTHANGGADELSVAGLSGALADPQTPTTHASAHQNGGADELSVAGLSGVLADAQAANALVVTGPTTLTAGAVADGQMFVRSGTTFIGAAVPTAQLDADELAAVQGANAPDASNVFATMADVGAVALPAMAHRWRASVNTNSGGFCDSLTDQGTGTPYDFTAAGLNRGTLGTDGLGNTYLSLDGVDDTYLAPPGTETAFTFMSDGSRYTIALVYADPSRPALGVPETILANSVGGGGNPPGMNLQVQHPTNGDVYYSVCRNDIPTVTVALESVNHVGGVMCLIVRCNGRQRTAAFAASRDFIMRREGRTVVEAPIAALFNSTDPVVQLLRLGSAVGGSGPWDGLLYELVIHNEAWSDRQVTAFEAYAADTYGVPL